MNKKGQSLVMFIIFLPLMIMALALVVDVGIMYNAKIKGERLIEEAKEKNLDIEEYFKINSIEIERDEIHVACNGSVSVSLQYGSDSEQEDDEPFIMSFPFEFVGTLKYEDDSYHVIDCDTIEVDTDAFYQ